MTNPARSGPWWREPWPWILMAGPFLAIVGCIITMTLAFRSFSDQSINDGAVRRGLVVEPVAKPPPSESR